MYVADMYTKVTQNDQMQRAFIRDSPQLRVIEVRFVSKFLLFCILINCVCIFI